MNNSLLNDALLPHLLDILANPASEGLILAGGFGLQLNRRHLRDTAAQTLIPLDELPDVRPTQDIDFFLQMELFVQMERGKAVRRMLDDLGYETHTKHLKFGKSLDAENPVESKIKIDLLARSPRPEENVAVGSLRVGKGADIDLHGRETPEAFAVEDTPTSLDVEGTKTDGQHVKGRILVPHPYAWINMKVMAAHDWLRTQGTDKAKPDGAKHVFDVYTLTAMLTEAEIAAAETLAQKYAANPVADEIKIYVGELYGDSDAPGFREAQRQVRNAIEHEVFWQGLCAVLGTAL